MTPAERIKHLKEVSAYLNEQLNLRFTHGPARHALDQDAHRYRFLLDNVIADLEHERQRALFAENGVTTMAEAHQALKESE